MTSESLKRSEKGLHSRIISVGPVMKPHLKSLIAPIVLSSACFLLQPLRPATQVRVVSKEEEKHEAWLRDRLREARSIKAGVSKADLLRYSLRMVVCSRFLRSVTSSELARTSKWMCSSSFRERDPLPKFLRTLS